MKKDRDSLHFTIFAQNSFLEKILGFILTFDVQRLELIESIPIILAFDNCRRDLGFWPETEQ